MVSKNLLWVLAAVVLYAGWSLLTNQNRKYSTEKYWQSATLEDVADVPKEALESAKSQDNHRVIMLPEEKFAELEAE